MTKAALGEEMYGNPVFTIGHSTHSLEDFIAMLASFHISCLVDVRAIPRSARYPQFNKENLPDALRAVGISYQHIASLGGRRAKPKDALYRNTLWKNKSFQNYADYATTPDFKTGLDELIANARKDICAIMCAEAVWWRCHRRIITDYLLAAGITVRHIMAEHKAEPAKLTQGAEITADKMLAYIAPQGVFEFIQD